MTTQTALPITDLAKPPEQPLIVQSNPLTIIERAIDRGCDPDQLEKLLALQERWEKNEAAKRYAEAITTFQAKCPRVLKSREAVIQSKKGEGSSYKYPFASYDDIMAAIHPLLAECQIGVDFTSDLPTEGKLKITCRLRVGTHTEDKTMSVPIPSLLANDTQRYGAALQYAKRYCLCAALNIVLTDDIDNDAAGLDEELVTGTMCEEIKATLDAKGRKLDAFIAWANESGFAKITSLEELTVTQYRNFKAMMRKK